MAVGDDECTAELLAAHDGISPSPISVSARRSKSVRCGMAISIVASMAAVIWLKGGASLATTGSVEQVVELTFASWMAEMLDAVNSERMKHGLSSVCYNEKLNAAALVHAKDMMSKDRSNQDGAYWHRGSDGSNPSDRARREGYNNGAYENVAWGHTTVAKAMKGWMESPVHRSNILTPSVSHFGFAEKETNWVQLFASPLGNDECMAAGGGVDGHGGRCRDVVPDGQTSWHDSDGHQYHCDWYGTGDRCAQHGHKFEKFGHTAQTACCVCGGGCADKKVAGGGEWYDKDGAGYHCNWYAEGDRCSEHGGKFENFGLVAQQACCACGGGDSAAAPAADLASGSASDAAAAHDSNGACCASPCETASDCANPLTTFCCAFHHICMGRDTSSCKGAQCDAVQAAGCKCSGQYAFSCS